MNDLDILAADVGNAYLNAPCWEKVYTICGKEFGPEYEGCYAVIVRALYGLKSSAAAWHAHLAETMGEEGLGFQSCKADPDVWLRPAVDSDGNKYYEYVLIYTDDILAISKKPKEILLHLDQNFFLKPDSIGPPTTYLGATILKFQLPNGNECWAMGSEQYVKEAIRNVEAWLEEHGEQKLKSKKAAAPLPSGYRPELDILPLLNDELANYYSMLIGILRWVIELARIDIAC